MSESSQHDLTGLTAVVTGSSSGIGRAIALELARAGAACVIHGRSSQGAAAQVADQINRVNGPAQVLMSDVGSREHHRGFVEQCWDWRDGVDIWVNNAGADTLTGEAAKWSFQRKLDRLWQVDVIGTIELSKLIGAKMKHRGRGVILNIGWDQAEQGMAGDSGELFAATKGAIMAFTRSLAQSLAPEVRVNCLAPGWIKTAWGDQASDHWHQRAAQESLRGRWGTPEDVARAAKFLASPASDFITGHILPINGGFNHRSS